jgi:hypothetical protein
VVSVWNVAAGGSVLAGGVDPSTAATSRVAGATRPRGRVALCRSEASESILDHERSVAWYGVEMPLLPLYERAAPARMIFSWWLAGRGMQLLHAAAVGEHGRGLLLAGAGGAGKSTTALLALRSGLEFAGDDTVIVGGDPPRIHSLYAAAKLRWETRDRYPELMPDPENREGADEKAFVFVHEQRDGRLVWDLALDAVLVPRPTDAERTELEPVAAGRALLALAPWTLMQLSRDQATTLRSLAGLVERAPCFRLALGVDPAGVVGALRDALAQATR